MFAAVMSASAAAALIAGHRGWTDVGIVALAGLAATIGGYSHPLAVATGRFIVILVISLSTMENGGPRAAIFALLLSGALWTSLVAFGLGSLLRPAGWSSDRASEPDRTASSARKYRRWIASLKTLAGWQFALRLVPSLAAAGVLRAAWPDHHLLWIAVTVAILCQRSLEPIPTRTMQRSVGAAVGVAATALLLGRLLPGWGLALLAGALAAFGSWLRAQNYLMYTASMTLLIILLLSAGALIEVGTLIDRLLATLIGAALVLAANMAVAKISNHRVGYAS
ncbi:MAG: FUSC family protein [Hyphomicrobiaceae bacterium]|nr:FUSC family protein [Hyphomicrobiaceae bacterium]